MKNDLTIAFVILVLTAAVWGVAHYGHSLDEETEIVKKKVIIHT